MYIQPNLRSTLSKEKYKKHVARGIVTLVKDLRECECINANVIRGMVKKVLQRGGVQLADNPEIVHNIIEAAEHEGKELQAMLRRVL